MSKKVRNAIFVLCVYIALLFILQYAESCSAESEIRTFYDALWYSLVTMTTVGYGDIVPVTAVGKIIGFVFLLLGAGFLVMLFSLATGFLMGRLFPKFALRIWHHRPVLIFTSICEESIYLASHLAEERPDAVFAYRQDGNEDDNEEILPGKRHICYKGNATDILPVTMIPEAVFVFGTDEFQNLRVAKQLASGNRTTVYCELDSDNMELPENISIFSRSINCARLYWQLHPLEKNEQKILLIGFDDYGKRLLEQALMVNVFGSSRRVEYHVIGSNGSFQREHTELSEFLDIDHLSGKRDAVIFHNGEWNEDRDLIGTADRIILCDDSDDVNLQRLSIIDRCYPIRYPVHIRLLNESDTGFSHTICFGSCSELFTPELVMLGQLNRVARIMNDIYCMKSGGNTPDWAHLTSFHRRSNMAAADHLPTKIRILLPDTDVRMVTADNCAAAYKCYQERKTLEIDEFRWIEHERWMRFHYLNNWRYAARRNNAERLHPLLIPYSHLPEAEKEKDDAAWELIEAVGEQIKN